MSYGPPSADELAQLLVDEAFKWVGTLEVGSNGGQAVEMFQRYIGEWVVGKPWCAAFVSYCLGQVERARGLDSPIFKSPRVLSIWEKSPPELRIKKPEPGCLVVWQMTKSGAGHIGIVKRIESDTRIITIEGNTGPAKIIQREGDGVYEKERAIRPVIGGMELVGFLRCWRRRNADADIS